MKGIAKKILVAVLAMVMLTVCIPQKVEAKEYYSYDSKELKQNVWGKVRYYSYISQNGSFTATYHMIRINVPANGYVKFETQNQDDSISVANKLKKNTSPSQRSFTSLSGRSVYYKVLPKGNNYLFVNVGHASKEFTNTKIRWSFIKASNPTNYCRGKAKKLTSGKKETIVFNDEYEYDRWYKITLKKRKPITVYYKCLDSDVNPTDPYFTVYTSTGDTINCPEYEKGKSFRTPIQNKGTYYIRIRKRDLSDYLYYDDGVVVNGWNHSGRIRTLSWK